MTAYTRYRIIYRPVGMARYWPVALRGGRLVTLLATAQPSYTKRGARTVLARMQQHTQLGDELRVVTAHDRLGQANG